MLCELMNCQLTNPSIYKLTIAVVIMEHIARNFRSPKSRFNNTPSVIKNDSRLCIFTALKKTQLLGFSVNESVSWSESIVGAASSSWTRESRTRSIPASASAMASARSVRTECPASRPHPGSSETIKMFQATGQSTYHLRFANS